MGYSPDMDPFRDMFLGGDAEMKMAYAHGLVRYARQVRICGEFLGFVGSERRWAYIIDLLRGGAYL